MVRTAAALALLLLSPIISFAETPTTTNSVGMKLIPIQAATFTMGSNAPNVWDQAPAHSVTITQPYFISEDPVTIDQYRKFKPNAQLNESCAPYAAGMTWYDANAFCAWLSKQ